MTEYINVTFTEEQAFTCSFEDTATMDITLGEIYRPAVYDGVIEVSSEQTVQVLETQGKLMPANIIIDPVPSYYGLITWNGAVLTVS